MEAICLPMTAIVEVRVGDRIEFTPGIGAMATEDISWSHFCRENSGKEGFITRIEYTPPKRTGDALVDMLHDLNDHPYFWVRLEGVEEEQRLKPHFLTVLEPHKPHTAVEVK